MKGGGKQTQGYRHKMYWVWLRCSSFSSHLSIWCCSDRWSKCNNVFRIAEQPLPSVLPGLSAPPSTLSSRAWSEQEPGSRQRWDSWPKLTRDTPCLVTSCSEIKCVSAYFKREPLPGDCMGIGLVMVTEAFYIPSEGDPFPPSSSPLCKTVLILIHEFSCFLLS